MNNCEIKKAGTNTSVLISIIIPVYNVRNYIRECLDSVISQTFYEYEIICVDDLSDDGTYGILEEYESRYEFIQVYRNVKKAGAAESRNYGLTLARGKYVIFLDGDDVFHNELLYRLYCACEEWGAQVSVCNFCIFPDGENTSEGSKCGYLPDKHVISSQADKTEVLKKPMFIPWNKLILRSFLLEQKILFQSLKNSNDVYFSLMVLSLAETVAIVNEALVFYRRGRKGNITEQRIGGKSYIVEAFQRYVNELKQRNLWSGVLKKTIIRMMIEQIFALVNTGEREPQRELMQDFRKKVLTDLSVDIQNINFPSRIKYKYSYLCDRVMNKKETYEIFSEKIHTFFREKRNVGLALWGAGKLGKRLLDVLGDDKTIFRCVIDNDIEKQGMTINGLSICAFDEVKDEIDAIIVLNPRYLDSIKNQVGEKYEVINFQEYLLFVEQQEEEAFWEYGIS